MSCPRSKLLAPLHAFVCAAIPLCLSLLGGCGTETKPLKLPKSTSNALDDAPSAVQSVDSEDQKVARAIRAGELEQARAILRKQLLLAPTNARATETLGDIAARQNNPREAIEYYRAAIELDVDASNALYNKLAEQWMVAGQPFEALAIQQALISKNPSFIQARFDLAGLASMLGLEQIATEQLKWLALHNQGHFEGLVVLAQPSLVQPDEMLCQQVLKRCPEDQRAQYGLARIEAMKLDWTAVATRLAPVVEKHADFLPAQSLYGRAIVELQDTQSVARWSQTLPPGIDESPSYWLAAGLWALHQGDDAMAARAFCEAVRREDGNSGETLSLLAGSLSKLGRLDDLERVNKRLERLAALHDATKTLYERENQSQLAALQVAKSMLALGRIWEAEAWARHAMSLSQDLVPNIKQEYVAIRARLTIDTPWQLAAEQPGEQINLEALPLVAWRPHANDPERSQALRKSSNYQFRDLATKLELNHITSISKSASTEGHWIYQSNGGGTAALDFDLDGWPDVAVAVLDGQPLKNDSRPDRLYRNHEATFVDVTEASGLQNVGFTQGLTVGDYNSDGFPDLFASNIGSNRLYRNNGDGTLSDVTDEVGLSGNLWTTSSAIVDINADGIADIFEVNYCGGNRPFEKACRNRTTGKLSSCTPLDFEAQMDRVWMGTQDGRFVNMTTQWMAQGSPGRGLGLVAGMLDELPGIDIYVANDMTANHLWSARNGENGFGLMEVAIARGVALSGQAVSQASMGIAVGDADGDQDLDLFLTHFADDHNTFYEQVSPGYWVDRSYPVKLAQPSMKLLGFGTQFIDVDNDGSLELMIANGHVSDVGRDDVAYRMPAQLFSRLPNEEWEEVDPTSLGEYFQKDHLGRSMITLDSNRDGKTDVLITHLFDPVALLVNETGTDEQAGRSHTSLGLYLNGTKSHRDAIGTEVTAICNGRKLYAQLTSGDGYLGTNQKKISLGLGAAESVSQLEVLWPSGERQRYFDLVGGRDYLLVEGFEEATELAAHLHSPELISEK